MSRTEMVGLWAALTVCLGVVPMQAATTTGPGGSGVTVGNSGLIQTLDLSDTFTGTTDGGNPNRPYVAAIQPPSAYVLENTHGNPGRSWTSSFSYASDRNPTSPGLVDGTPTFPGNPAANQDVSGSGTLTGFTQTGGTVDYGVPYGLRTQFVAQFDAVQNTDRVDITSSDSLATIGGTNGLSVFFRASGGPNPQIGLYNGATETDTGLTSGIVGNTWNNYAVAFDRPNNMIEVFVNEVTRGSVDLDTFAGGAYANFGVANVNLGGAGGNRVWSDNAQIGSRVARGVPAGASSLIGTLDYSDSFTLTAKGGNPGRVATTSPENPPATNVENSHGNAPRQWTAGQWSLTYDPNVWSTGASPYSGGSGAGSNTGFTQTGGGGKDWGIQYGLRRDFIVQTDFVQNTDRVDIIAGATTADINAAHGLAVFFRRTGHAGPEIGLYSQGIGEKNTGLTSGIASADEWHNYAVRFDTVRRSVEFFVDEVSRGTVNLDTVGGGAFSSLAVSNQAVSIGFRDATGDRGWGDNFQVGSSKATPVTLPALDAVDYRDTFTINPPARPDGLYNNNAGGGYNVEQTFGNPPATWTPLGNFSFNTPGSSTNPVLLGAAGGNGGTASGLAQSGGGDFSFAYGLRSNYIVSIDAILPSDRLDISSLSAPGVGIYGANGLSVFFRRDTTTQLPAIGLFDGSTETGVLAPGTLGISDNDWHNFAVWFDQDNDTLGIYVDRELVADLDLTTFAGGIYQNYSNAAVGAGGKGGVFWVDNFQVGAIPEPMTAAMLCLAVGAVGGYVRRRRKA